VFRNGCTVGLSVERKLKREKKGDAVVV